MKKHIIIAGGTGFLGHILEHYLVQKGYQITILTRNPKQQNHCYWNAKDLGKWQSSLENSLAIINLTGKSVDCRYTSKNKVKIYHSRIDSTRVIGEAIARCENPPKVWMNSSTATIYRHATTTQMCEENGEIGDDFSMNIAKSWETTFYGCPTPKTRKIALRTSIVLGTKGGALVPLQKITKIGLGGHQGNGLQKVSFIHELDFARAIAFLLENNSVSGNFNITAPKPTNNATLMQTLRSALSVPIGIAQPKWLLEIGTFFLRTETELILKSRNVIPKRLIDEGFTFKYPSIEHTIKDLIPKHNI